MKGQCLIEKSKSRIERGDNLLKGQWRVQAGGHCCRSSSSWLQVAGWWFRVCWDVCSAAIRSLGKSPRSAFYSYKEPALVSLPWGSGTMMLTYRFHHTSPTAQPHVMLLFTVQPGAPSTTHPCTQHQAALPPHL